MKSPDVNETDLTEGADAVRERLARAKPYKRVPNGADDHGGAIGQDATGQLGQEPEAPPPEILPFKTFRASDWEGVEVEPQPYLINEVIPLGEVGILSGDGGTGKTRLAAQLAAAITSERICSWLNFEVKTHGPVVILTGEERLKQMHRKMAIIADYYNNQLEGGFSFANDLKHLHIIAERGKEENDFPLLARVDRLGRIEPTKTLLRLEKTVSLIKPALVLAENAADVFDCEIERHPVTRFMRDCLGMLTLPSFATVCLIQHPSLTGLSSGTGSSGSTAWNNAARWRHNFTKVKSDDEADNDARELHVIKNNYGPDGQKVRVRWQRGFFVPENSYSPEAEVIYRDAEKVFMNCLDVSTAQNVKVGPNSGKNYAPDVFSTMMEAKDIKKSALVSAMGRLMQAGRITRKTVGPPSKERDILVRSEPHNGGIR